MKELMLSTIADILTTYHSDDFQIEDKKNKKLIAFLVQLLIDEDKCICIDYLDAKTNKEGVLKSEKYKDYQIIKELNITNQINDIKKINLACCLDTNRPLIAIQFTDTSYGIFIFKKEEYETMLDNLTAVKKFADEN